MFAALSIAALAIAGGMIATAPPTTFDPVASATNEKPTVVVVAQSNGTHQPTL